MKKFSKVGWTALVIFMSSLMLFAAIVDEVEPNESAATAMPVILGDDIRGIISTMSDKDVFRYNNLVSGIYQFDFSYPDGSASHEDWVTITDSAGVEFPYYCVWNGSTHVTFIKICTISPVFVRVAANGQFGLTNKTYQFKLVKDADPECNDNYQTARVVPSASVLTGKFPVPNDPDYFKLLHVAPGPFTAAINNSQPGPAIEMALYKDPTAAPIATAAPGVNTIDYTIATTGTYYLLVKYADADTASQYPYNLALLYLNSCSLQLDSAANVITPTNCGQSTGNINIAQPLDGVAPYNYSLNGGVAQSTGVFTDLPEGNYTVVITDAANCTAEFATTINCVVACDPPQIGVSLANVEGNKITLNLVQQNVDSLVIDYGNGSPVTDSTIYIYPDNGDYTVKITAFNACGSATATTTVSIRSATFRMGWQDNVQIGDTIKLPLIVVKGNFQISGWTGTVSLSNPALGKFIGIAPGTLTTSSLSINLNNGKFAASAPASANQSIEVGDTVLYFRFVVTGGMPGDSTDVHLDQNVQLPFEFSIFFNNFPQTISTTYIAGGFSLVKEVEIRVDVRTPTGTPVDSVKIDIITPDTTIVGYSDNTGQLVIKVPYAASIVIQCSKMKAVWAGINTIDAFIIPRILVGLAVSGITQYSPLAGARMVAPYNALSVIDATSILEVLVGNQPLPPNQHLIIPAAHVFPPFPDAQYFNYPTDATVLSPDPVAGVSVSFVDVIAGDVNHSANPNFNSPLEDRSGLETQWGYSTEQDESLIRVLLAPSDASITANGLLDFGYDATRYEFISAGFVQSKNSYLLVTNTKSAGSVKLAFLNQDGTIGRFDNNLPLMELVLRAKVANAGMPEITLATTSMLADEAGDLYHVVLERNDQVTVQQAEFKVFPNPAQNVLYVSLPAREQSTVLLYDAMGHQVYTTTSSDNDLQVALPVDGLPSGVYMCKVVTKGKILAQKIEVIH
jgi:PKD repeat protein